MNQYSNTNRADNRLNVASVCHLLPTLLKMPLLCKVDFDSLPSECATQNAWKQEGLDELSDELVNKGWVAVLRHFKEASNSIL
jgi:hypothetical protein